MSKSINVSDKTLSTAPGATSSSASTVTTETNILSLSFPPSPSSTRPHGLYCLSYLYSGSVYKSNDNGYALLITRLHNSTISTSSYSELTELTYERLPTHLHLCEPPCTPSI